MWLCPRQTPHGAGAEGAASRPGSAGKPGLADALDSSSQDAAVALSWLGAQPGAAILEDRC